MSRKLQIASVLLFLMFAVDMHAKSGDSRPSDPEATGRTVELFARMENLMSRGVMIGHQDDLAYGHQNYRPGVSDVKKISGDYPAVIGWDIGHLELGNEHNLDSVYFSVMKEQIRKTDARGGITTISWHCDNIVTGGSTWDVSSDEVVSSVLPGGANHDRYMGWLDSLALFFKSLKDRSGNDIPVIFRLYHEHTGSWFWWGKAHCSPSDYIAMWRMTVDYFRTSGVHNLLIAYSPGDCMTAEEYMERYPGDEYVDVVGFDIYQNGNDASGYSAAMSRNIDIVTDYASVSGKIPAISETGSEGIPQKDYFTSVIWPLLQGRELSYILFWRNAYEQDKPGHFYLPYKGHPAASDFVELLSYPRILMNKDIR
ncbi:MAG: endoglucanase [Bacteroidetes bacterium]|uniref:Mannan endo-1,4-beta-mannosidase n=1 Tax=Candidatus Cryptobacteroides avicola TaxID=2840757 RepID=A0A940DRB8_9BACT|nr:endoglucanase [Candidatus Cryptobacteroides avicola]